VDFGAEESFSHASERVQEHYGIEIAVSTLRAVTLDHAKKISRNQAQKPKVRLLKGKGKKQIISEIDGTFIPMVEMKEESKADRRKCRKVYWKECRLAAGQAKEEIRAYYTLLGTPQKIIRRLDQHPQMSSAPVEFLWKL
jgi:hypothetical protein